MTDSPDRIKAGEYAVWVFAVSEGSVWGHMTQCAWAEHTHTSVNVSRRILLTSQEPGSRKSRILCPKGKKETGTVHFQQAALKSSLGSLLCDWSTGRKRAVASPILLLN